MYDDNAYPGPEVSGPAKHLSGILSTGSDGSLGTKGNTDWELDNGPNSKPYPNKYKQTIVNPKFKESSRRRKAIKKMQRLDMLSFADFSKKKD